MSRKAAQELVDAIESWIVLTRSEGRVARSRKEVERYREALARDLGGTPIHEERGADVAEQLVASQVDIIGVMEAEDAFWRVLRALHSAASFPLLQSGTARIVELLAKARRISNTKLLRIELPLIDPSERSRQLADWGNVAEHSARCEDEALMIAREMLRS